METNLTNTTSSDIPMSGWDAEMQEVRIREIMKETGEPFGPAVNIYIKETYGKPIENN